jgi:hypothetical protein
MHSSAADDRLLNGGESFKRSKKACGMSRPANGGGHAAELLGNGHASGILGGAGDLRKEGHQLLARLSGPNCSRHSAQTFRCFQP